VYFSRSNPNNNEIWYITSLFDRLSSQNSKGFCMRFIFNRKVGFILLLLCIAVTSSVLVYALFGTGNTIVTLQQPGNTPSPTVPALNTPNTPPQTCVLKQSNVEMGVAFPQWNANSYSANDSQWVTELPQMRAQTASCWVEMPVLFHQATLYSTKVLSGNSTPGVSSFLAGLKYAHALGLHVFVTMLVDADGPQPWAGSIEFSTYTQEQQWFTSYWQAIQPYAVAAEQAGAEQFALGTEEEWLQENAPATLWNGLIANVHNVFHGILTYDMNWTSLQKSVPDWIHNSALDMVGISAYFPVISTSERVAPEQMPALWATAVKRPLDTYATLLDKPIFISEIGYRNSSNDFYKPWVTQSSSPADPQEQAGAYGAALVNVLADKQIQGIFCWGWDGAGGMNIKGTQATTTIHQYYASLQV
jgi:hypothetical protein